MTSGHDPFLTDTPSEWGKGAASRMFRDRAGLFIAHVEKRENFTGVRKRFDQAASAAGCHEESLETIPDSNGRPVFEVFKIACETRGQ